MKILVTGGFGVGKTTAIGAVSEIEPISTEEYLTEGSAATDSLAGVEAKSHTTVAFDFGRISLDLPMPIELMLFGTPGQDRFMDLWDDLARGAVGIVVLADTRRLESSFPAVTFCERTRLPFVVAVNQFDHAHRYPLAEIRDAFILAAHVPVVTCDARDPTSVAAVLLHLVDHALSLLTASSPPTSLDA
ncbi:GTP-binding protein [Streptomyces justiciae]|uniref:GTP-binding protein n=1 Tax=Streptomyces justiciae TaxID=2780140 RepID=UPI002118FFB6|nr:ATP/GTP-binding protein [Streptomyces justiciae]MCW8379831.1 ATP/GTP-binding protein [Streptomyces justiciae]